MKLSDKYALVRYSIFATLASLLGLWFVYQIRNILIILFVAFILMSALRPLVVKAQKFHIPRPITVLLVYLLVLFLLFGVIASFIPLVVAQTTNLIDNLPAIWGFLESRYHLQIDTSLFSQHFQSVPTNLFRLAGGFFSNILGILAVFFLAYYLLVERDNIHRHLAYFFDSSSQVEKQVERFLRSLESKIGHWVIGQLILMFVIGMATYIGLLLLKVPYALPLALLAGVLEVVPNIGPTISTLISVLVGLTVSPLTALGALILGIVIQQLENNLIVPKVMQYTVGMSPIITLTVLLIGLELGGIVGAILAIPLYLLFVTIFEFKKPSKGGSHATTK